MKLGMLTACLPDWTLEQIVSWASTVGYDALEVAVWPHVGGRSFEASHIPVATLTADDARRTKDIFARQQLQLSALAYYENNLHPDRERRTQIHRHLRHVIDAASALEVPYVGTFIGRDPRATVLENMREAERVFASLVSYASDHGIQLIVENCVMEGWHPDGYPGNLAYSPELWEWMFTLGLQLNWDPSHLAWLGIDPIETIAPYIEHIAHAQAKDIQLDTRARNRYGSFGIVDKGGDPWRTGWWRYRIPGRGQLDWNAITDRLYDAGFTGTLSVEHEDPIWGSTDERILEGLRIAQRTLRPLVANEHASEATSELGQQIPVDLPDF